MTTTTTGDDVTTDPSEGWGRFARAAAPLVALLLLIIGGSVAAVVWDDTHPTDTTVTTFVDAHGRACTQVTAATTAAVDCDYPPAENRLGGFLDDLNEGTQP